MNYRLKPTDMFEKKATLVQPTWRRSAASTLSEATKKSSFVNKPSTVSSQSKQNVEGILKELVIKSPAKPIYDENTVFVNNTVYESPSMKNTTFSSPAGDDGYITANELSASKAMSDGVEPFNLSFSGYSVRKSGCWSGSSTPKYRDIPSRPSEGSVKFSSPHAQRISLKGEIHNIRAENERLVLSLKEKDQMIVMMQKEMEIVKQRQLQTEAVMKIALEQTNQKLIESENQRKMAWEEVNAMNFLSSVQEQRIQEAEERVTTTMLDCDEKIAEKSKKNKQMKIAHAEYEVRAQAAIAETTEQMMAIQTLALQRIEVLEKELMVLRRTNADLVSDVTTLKAAAEASKEVEYTYDAQYEDSPLELSNEWTSPPAKFSRPSVNTRRSSAMFRGGAGINVALHNDKFKTNSFAISEDPVYEEDEEDEEEDQEEVGDDHEDGSSDGDTVVDENELEDIEGLNEEEQLTIGDVDNFGHSDWQL